VPLLLLLAAWEGSSRQEQMQLWAPLLLLEGSSCCQHMVLLPALLPGHLCPWVGSKSCQWLLVLLLVVGSRSQRLLRRCLLKVL
jgi:hypothetical protein